MDIQKNQNQKNETLKKMHPKEKKRVRGGRFGATKNENWNVNTCNRRKRGRLQER